MEKFYQIPIFGPFMGLLINGMKVVGGFFEYLFDTSMLGFLESIPINSGFFGQILTTIKNWYVNVIFGALGIPEEVSVGGFLLFYGVFVIFIVWIVKFFMDIVT